MNFVCIKSNVSITATFFFYMKIVCFHSFSFEITVHMNYFFNKGEKNDVNILIDLYDYFYSSDAHFYLYFIILFAAFFRSILCYFDNIMSEL